MSHQASEHVSKHASQLTLRDVGFRVDNKNILQNVNLSLPAQGITAVLGFNGAGKSVLLKIMHGIVAPSTGSVLWDEQQSTAEHRMSQAMVFQKPVLLRRSVKANIDFVLNKRNLQNNNKSKTARRAELLAMVGLSDAKRQPARLLSGGEQQRLALARALACNPNILFLDEATASLDAASTALIEKIVINQAQSGTKIIMVTHDAAQATRLSDDVVFMHAGSVAEHTASNQFFSNPTSVPAQAYLQGKLYTDEH